MSDSTMSCLQALPRSYILTPVVSFMEPIYLLLGLPLFWLPLIIPALLSFPKIPTFSCFAQSRTASVLLFASSKYLGLICYNE